MARALQPEERAALGPFFPSALLSSIRIAFVDTMAQPPFLAGFEESRHGEALDFPAATGLSLGDTIVIKRSVRPEDQVWLPLLFHELVHSVQYEVLGGAEAFVPSYAQGLFATGFVYRKIPHEVQAYELQARFEEARDVGFSVEEEVRRSFGERSLGWEGTPP